MRDPRNALTPFLVKETADSLEKIAAKLCDVNVIAEEAIAAATRGEWAIRITDRGLVVDVRSTEAARKLAEWAKANRMTLEWLERAVERSNGLKVMIAEPVISWGGDGYIRT